MLDWNARRPPPSISEHPPKPLLLVLSPRNGQGFVSRRPLAAALARSPASAPPRLLTSGLEAMDPTRGGRLHFSALRKKYGKSLRVRNLALFDSSKQRTFGELWQAWPDFPIVSWSRTR